MDNYMIINNEKFELSDEIDMRIDDIKKVIKALGMQKGRAWRAPVDGLFYFVDISDGVRKFHEKGDKHQDEKYLTGNYFRTKEEAEYYEDIWWTWLNLRKFINDKDDYVEWDGVGEHFYMYADIQKPDEIGVGVTRTLKMPHVLYFSSVDMIKVAIEEIGRDKIIAYLNYKW